MWVGYGCPSRPVALPRFAGFWSRRGPRELRKGFARADQNGFRDVRIVPGGLPFRREVRLRRPEDRSIGITGELSLVPDANAVAAQTGWLLPPRLMERSHDFFPPPSLASATTRTVGCRREIQESVWTRGSDGVTCVVAQGCGPSRPPP